MQQIRVSLLNLVICFLQWSHHPCQSFSVRLPLGQPHLRSTGSSRLPAGPPLNNDNNEDFPPDNDDIPTNNGDQQQDCEDEEECEIDWDAMPPMDTTSNSVANTPPPHAVTESTLKRLEMQWQLAEAVEDCDVEEPQSCGSEPCEDCRGKGWQPCRFCRGTKTLYLPTDCLPQQQQHSAFVACNICAAQGQERCRSCQGTGWVAGWTQLQGSAH